MIGSRRRNDDCRNCCPCPVLSSPTVVDELGFPRRRRPGPTTASRRRPSRRRSWAGSAASAAAAAAALLCLSTMNHDSSRRDSSPSCLAEAFSLVPSRRRSGRSTRRSLPSTPEASDASPSASTKKKKKKKRREDRQQGPTASAAAAGPSSRPRATSKARPIDRNYWSENRFPAKEHCSLCGLCETSSYVGLVKEACPFLGDAMSRIDQLEPLVHGRNRGQGGDLWDANDNDDRSSSPDETLVWDDSPRALQEDFDEGRFGVMVRPVSLAKGVNMTPEAQWTGVVTSLAVSLLEAKWVDAVVCVAAASETSSSDDETGRRRRSIPSPEPILARTVDQVLRGRGVKPVLAPCLSLLDEIRDDPTITRLLFCGVGCAVQALRSVEEKLGLETLLVIGTNCADNSPTAEAADRFVRVGVLGSDRPVESMEAPAIRGYEFMPDFRVHVKTDNEYLTQPYFSLASSLASSSIAPSCLACSDYTNALADVVVGYMGAPYPNHSKKGPQRMDQSWQTLTVRNDRGARMVDMAIKAGRLHVQPFEQHFKQPSNQNSGAGGTGFLSRDSSSGPPRRHKFERLVLSTVESDAIVKEMMGQAVPDSGLPEWLGNIIANVLTDWVAPTDVSFARYSIDYHLLRNYLHMVHAWGPVRANQSIPKSAMHIVAHYKTNYLGFARLVEQVERIYSARQSSR